MSSAALVTCCAQYCPGLLPLTLLRLHSCSLQVLEWLAYTMVKDNQIAEAEMLLASYCMSRRNPLSSVAAVEHAIVQVNCAG